MHSIVRGKEVLFRTAMSVAMLLMSVSAKGEDGSDKSVTSAYRTVVDMWLEGVTPDVPNKCGLPALAHAMQQQGISAGMLGNALAAMNARPATQKSILVGSFRIHYDTTGMHEPAILNEQHQRIPGTADRFADSVAAIADYVLRIESDTLGYLPPPRDNGAGGGPEYDIYIQKSGGAFYGYTTPETPIIAKPEGGTFTTFIVIDNDFTFVFPDSNKGLPGLRVTLAHELHHAIQIGNYGFWQNDVYFYEMTSVWMEDVVFTEVNDYYQYLRSGQGHFRNPHVPFTSNAFIMYSRGIWGNFIAKHYGTETMLRAWNAIAVHKPLQAIDAALQQAGSGLRKAFGEWSVWNFYTGGRADSVRYYPEGSFYPLILEMAVGFTPPSRAIVDSIPALSSRYHDVMGGQAPLKLVTSNINIPAAISGSTAYHRYSYQLNTTMVDQSYLPTTSRIFVKFEATDRSNWISVVDTSGVSIVPPSPNNAPFPSPFVANGSATLRIPIQNFGPTSGTLTIYSGSMDLVYSHSSVSGGFEFGKQVFLWDGQTNDARPASSGVYIYVLELPGQTINGKFALIRR